ncbi:hypothetical protein TRIP_C20365 [Candidatus Zixiibacteriota bacterium]|nr:hypothetical protein TRIP_C20365 [candidate division Zixibacteria bacterium]
MTDLKGPELTGQELKVRMILDKVYKREIPAARQALEELKAKFSGLESRTDWYKLRIEPLLRHARTLEQLLLSPEFSRETSRLTRGVVMFRSDLVYLRENLRALQLILKSGAVRTGTAGGGQSNRKSKRNHG